jgi:hypothetical protein
MLAAAAKALAVGGRSGGGDLSSYIFDPTYNMRHIVAKLSRLKVLSRRWPLIGFAATGLRLGYLNFCSKNFASTECFKAHAILRTSKL